MKTTKLFISILFCILLLNNSCKKDNDVQLDKQVRLEFGNFSQSFYISTGDTSWQLIKYSDCILINFNKTNYAEIKSIIFSASIFSNDTSNYCNVELYDLTNNISIQNSQIKSNQKLNNGYATFIESSDILNSLPDETIDLALRIKSSELDKNSTFGNSYIVPKMYLFLNR